MSKNTSRILVGKIVEKRIKTLYDNDPQRQKSGQSKFDLLINTALDLYESSTTNQNIISTNIEAATSKQNELKIKNIELKKKYEQVQNINKETDLENKKLESLISMSFSPQSENNDKKYLDLFSGYLPIFAKKLRELVSEAGKNIYNTDVEFDTEIYCERAEKYCRNLFEFLKHLHPEFSKCRINLEIDSLLNKISNRYSFPQRVITKRVQNKRLGKKLLKIINYLGVSLSYSWISHNRGNDNKYAIELKKIINNGVPKLVVQDNYQFAYKVLMHKDEKDQKMINSIMVDLEESKGEIGVKDLIIDKPIMLTTDNYKEYVDDLFQLLQKHESTINDLFLVKLGFPSINNNWGSVLKEFFQGDISNSGLKMKNVVSLPPQDLSPDVRVDNLSNFVSILKHLNYFGYDTSQFFNWFRGDFKSTSDIRKNILFINDPSLRKFVKRTAIFRATLVTSDDWHPKKCLVASSLSNEIMFNLLVLPLWNEFHEHKKLPIDLEFTPAKKFIFANILVYGFIKSYEEIFEEHPFEEQSRVQVTLSHILGTVLPFALNVMSLIQNTPPSKLLNLLCKYTQILRSMNCTHYLKEYLVDLLNFLRIKKEFPPQVIKFILLNIKQSPVKIEYKNSNFQREASMNRPELKDIIKIAKDGIIPESRIFDEFLEKRYDIKLPSDLREEFEPKKYTDMINFASEIIQKCFDNCSNSTSMRKSYDFSLIVEFKKGIIDKNKLKWKKEKVEKLLKAKFEFSDIEKQTFINELYSVIKSRKPFDLLSNMVDEDRNTFQGFSKNQQNNIKKTLEFTRAVQKAQSIELLDSLKILHRIRFNVDGLNELKLAHEKIRQYKQYQIQKKSGSKSQKGSVQQNTLFSYNFSGNTLLRVEFNEQENKEFKNRLIELKEEVGVLKEIQKHCVIKRKRRTNVITNYYRRTNERKSERLENKKKRKIEIISENKNDEKMEIDFDEEDTEMSDTFNPIINTNIPDISWYGGFIRR